MRSWGFTYMKIFISYSSKDGDVATELCDVLEAQGMECFIAPRNIRSGHVYAEEIIRGLEEADTLVLLLTNRSNESAHVMREVERAVSTGKNILTYRLEDVRLTPSMEYFLMSTQWLDAADDPDRQELIGAIQALQTESVNEDEGADQDASAAESPMEKKTATKKAKKANTWKLIACLGIAAWLVTCIILGIVLIKNKSKNSGSASESENGTNLSGADAERETDEQEDLLPAEFELGMKITFGQFNSEPIDWRVIHINDDGSAVIIAENVLSFKAYDAAESGRYLYTADGEMPSQDVVFTVKQRRECFGNNTWAVSNIRTWLNSEAGKTVYQDQAPVTAAMSDKANAYVEDAGFLHDFTAEELARILPTNHFSVVSDETTRKPDRMMTEDRVYLLSVEELAWLDEAGVNTFAKPTQAAIEHNNSTRYQNESLNYNVEASEWWLRDVLEESTEGVLLVQNGYTGILLGDYIACVGGCGVRPAMTVR